MSLKGAKRYLPHGVVFVSSMGMMIVELVASRLIAKYFGDSLFTWAGIIGVILGGTSLGNFIGGRTADRHRPERAVPVLLLISSVLVFSILLVDLLLGRIVGEVGSIEVTAGYIFRSVLVIAVLFFLPSTALGTISPVMAKYAIESDEHVGNTVGGIYAVSSIGSIAGTFLAGFLLIPLFGIRTIVFVVALVLALLGLTMKGMKVILGTWAALIVLSLLFIPGVTGRVDALAGAAAAPEVSGDDSREDRILFADDSPYSYIEVKDENGKRYLVMDGLIHNMHDLSNPDNLLYDYEKIFLCLTREREEETMGRGLSTITLGGGAMTFPSYLTRHFSNGSHEVVEIDAEVVDVARRYFDAPDERSLKLHTADARNYVAAIRGKRSFDIVYLDAFNSFSVPYHLTTKEFTESIREILKPDGTLFVNAIDIIAREKDSRTGGFLAAYYNTLRSVFPSVVLYADTSFSPGIRSTFVLAASESPLASGVLSDPDGTPIAHPLPDETLRVLEEKNGGMILTDDHAPVEKLMMPVFIDNILKYR